MSKLVSSPVLGSWIWEGSCQLVTHCFSGSLSFSKLKTFFFFGSPSWPSKCQLQGRQFKFAVYWAKCPQILFDLFLSLHWQRGLQGAGEWGRYQAAPGPQSGLGSQDSVSRSPLIWAGCISLKHLAFGTGLYLTASKWLFFLVLLKEPDPSHKFSINGIINWYNFKSKNAELVCGKHKHVFGVRCKLV